MKIFSEKHQELKDFEEIILDIEKERDTLDYCRASIRSCLWNLESPKIELVVFWLFNVYYTRLYISKK